MKENGYNILLAWELSIYLLDEKGKILTPTIARGRKLISRERMWVGVDGLDRQSVWRFS